MNKRKKMVLAIAGVCGTVVGISAAIPAFF